MKEVKKERKVIDTLYVANDGTEFTTADACKEYEKTANAVIRAKFKAVCAPNEVSYGGSFYNYLDIGNYDDAVVLLLPKSSEDVRDINNYIAALWGADNVPANRLLGDDAIGKEILFGKSYYDECDDWLIGTKDEIVSRVASAVDKAIKAMKGESDEKDNK